MSETPAAPTVESSAPEPDTGQRVKRFFLLLLFYAAVGPPVGSIILVIIHAISSVNSLEDVQYVFLAPFVGLLMAPLSYLLGAVPAALGGTFVAGWQAFFGRISFAGILALGSVLGLVFVFATDGLGTLVQKVVNWGQVVAAFFVALLPTVICWYPMRKRYYPAAGSSAIAKVPAGIDQ